MAEEFFAWYCGKSDWDEVDLDYLEETIADGDWENIPSIRDNNYAEDLVKYIFKHRKEKVTIQIEDSGYGDYEHTIRFKDGGVITVSAMDAYLM